MQATLRSLAGRVTRRFLIPFRRKGSARIDARRRETRRCRRPLSLSLFLSPPPLSRTHNPWVEIARRNRAEEGGWMGGCRPIPLNRNRVVRNVVVLPSSSWFLSRFAPEGFVGPPTSRQSRVFLPLSRGVRRGKGGRVLQQPGR